MLMHIFILTGGLVLAAAPRPATVHEVQPSTRDRVHSIWLNGPTFSGKLSGAAHLNWPSFQDDSATRLLGSSNLFVQLESSPLLKPCRAWPLGLGTQCVLEALCGRF